MPAPQGDAGLAWPPREAARLEALQWLEQQRQGMGERELAAFEQWLDRQPLNREAFQSLSAIWSALDALPAAQAARLRALAGQGGRAGAESAPAGAWTPYGQETAAAGMPGAARSTHPPRLGRRRLLRTSALLGVAGALLVAGGGSWVAWTQIPLQTLALASGKGELRRHVLEDGSVLTLDAMTRIEIAFYRNRREVRLAEGQVMFDVQHDPGRPFQVLAGPATVTVLGTHFSVRYVPSMPEKQGASVMVAQGRVRVESAGGTVELTDGQSITVDDAGRPGAVRPVAPAAVGQWRQGRLAFTDTPLANVLAELRRHGAGEHLVVHDPAVAALRVSTSLDLARAGELDQILPRVLPVRLLRQGRVTEIAAR